MYVSNMVFHGFWSNNFTPQQYHPIIIKKEEKPNICSKSIKFYVKMCVFFSFLFFTFCFILFHQFRHSSNFAEFSFRCAKSELQMNQFQYFHCAAIIIKIKLIRLFIFSDIIRYFHLYIHIYQDDRHYSFFCIDATFDLSLFCYRAYAI